MLQQFADLGLAQLAQLLRCLQCLQAVRLIIRGVIAREVPANDQAASE